MTDQEDNINLGKIVFDDNNQERKSRACLGQTCSKIADCVSVPTFCHLWLLLGIPLSKTCDESIVWVGILRTAAGHILPSPRL